MDPHKKPEEPQATDHRPALLEAARRLQRELPQIAIDCVVLSTSAAREQLPHLVTQVAERRLMVTITGRRKNAVLVSEEDWLGVLATLELYEVPGLVASIKEEMARPMEEFVPMEAVDW